MEPGPLPPHERTWRHPSEIAAAEHAAARAATAPATTRVFAITSGTLGLLAVGLLVLVLTPSRSDAPLAISATTTPAVAGTSAMATTVGTSGRAPVGLRGPASVLATPIGDGRFAVVTSADLSASVELPLVAGADVEVRVPSGRTLDAQVVGWSGDTALVELAGREPGVEVAAEQPDGHEVVTVLAEPPVTIVLDDLPSLVVDEGTAVLDHDGDLVGLCSESHDQTRLVAVSEELAGATNGG